MISGTKYLSRKRANHSGARVFPPRVHLFPQLLVPATACAFSRFESDVPPGGSIRRDISTKKNVTMPGGSRTTVIVEIFVFLITLVTKYILCLQTSVFSVYSIRVKLCIVKAS